MSNCTVDLLYEGFDEVRKSTEMESILEEICNDAIVQLGDGYNYSLKEMSSRTIAMVYTDNEEAMKDNLENNTLLKVLNV